MIKKLLDKILISVVFFSFFNFVYQAYSFSGETVIDKLLKDKQELNALSSLKQVDYQFVLNSKKLIKYKQEIKEVQDKLRTMNKEEETLKIKMNNIQNNIIIIKEKVQITEKTINKQKESINIIEKELKDLEIELEEQLKEIYVYIRLIEENSHYNLVKMFINTDNLSELIEEINILEMMENNSCQVFQELINIKKKTISKKNELIEEKQILDNFTASLAENINELEFQKKQQANILKVTNNDEAVFKQLLINLNNQYTEVKKMLTNLDFSQIKMNSLIKEEFVKKAKILKERNQTFSYIWPVDPSRGLSAYFKDKSYKRHFGYEHEAIDIKVYQGTEILSPAYGYVYKIVDNDLEYSYLIMAHPGNVFTLYGHISEFLVEEWELVEKGEKIALSGGMPGTKGAGIFTTWPHLHFEMYKKGQVRDPLLELPLANFPLEKISLDYLDRYKNIIKRIIRKSQLLLIGWEPQERAEYLLNRFAENSFKDIEIWEKVGKEYQIDPYFLICVGLAETSLGNRTKTTNNVGNVGNTDSGTVSYYPTPQAGVTAIGQVLNNKYLGKYQMLGELSRWWNKDSFIYASSSVNWFSNVSKCLSGIYGEFVDDDFLFRR